MLVPINWLKDYVDIDCTPQELGDKLVSAGFEIEGIIDQASLIQNVVVGKILSMDKHPNADKLQVCKVDIGTKALQIVTGATNVAVSDIVPVALDGALLSGGVAIKKGELRGVLSEGMFCGGEELGLTENDYPNAGVDGVLILQNGTVIGEDINNIVGNDDVILDISITSNRTDANSIYGIAREVSAITNKPLRPLPLKYKENKEKISDYISLENKDSDLCPRYMAKVVKDIKLTDSPNIIKKRLKAVGIRPLNNIVDITNYVLIEVGQPMHAFDIATINGKKIVVRRAVKGEKIVALDDKTYELNDKNLVIANDKEAMAVAGIMGGRDYSILPSTNTIVLESARFARDNVRRTTRTINLRSDSSQRFEKGVDYYSQPIGLDRALALIEEYGYGTIVGGTLDSYQNPTQKKTITFKARDIEKVLGIAIDDKKIKVILDSLTLYTKLEDGVFTTEIPQYREDMVGINDIAEEIIRIYGYDKIPHKLINKGKMIKGGKTQRQHLADKMKNILVAKGACEVVTYSFITPRAFDLLCLPKDSELRQSIKLDNPLGEDYSVMRTTLSHSMLKVVATNFVRGNKEGRFFEIAKTYIPKSLPITEYPIEKNKLCISAYGEDFYSFKAIIEDMLQVFRLEPTFIATTLPYMHATRTASVIANGVDIGYIGEVDEEVAQNYGIDKKVYLAEIDAEFVLDNAKVMEAFKVVSKYPAIERDLAVVADNTLTATEIISAVNKSGGSYLVSAEIFDVYIGGQIASGKKSVAIKLLFQSHDKTLVDNDVNASIDNILKGLSKLGAVLR